MAENSHIEWTDHTFNPWWGCAKVSPGCKHCYAETLAHRYHPGNWGVNGTRKMMSEAYWKQPEKWNRKAAEAGRIDRVFCASMADVFEDRPELVDPRQRLFQLIEGTPSLMWLLLTKRPENVLDMVWWGTFFDLGTPWPDNVCIMTSVENQEMADQRIPQLLAIPSRYRGLSVEPLLGPVDLKFGLTLSHDDWRQRPEAIHWVIVGGESGPGARPMHPDWARSIRDQCVMAGVPFFFKQWGAWIDTLHGIDADAINGKQEAVYVDSETGAFSDARFGARAGRTTMQRVDKKRAGRLLDGREWNDHPFELEKSK
jgi:protein gp37